MIKGFEKYTQPLKDDERKAVLYLREMLEDYARLRAGYVKNEQIRKMLLYRMPEKRWTSASIRKVCHNARTSGLIPCLVANSEGYRIARTMDEVTEYLEGLQGRIDAMVATKRAIYMQASQSLSAVQGDLFDK